MSALDCQCSVNYACIEANTCVSTSINRKELEWKWDPEAKCPGVDISEEGRNVTLHMRYSSGTAAARGDVPFVRNYHYFWEIQICTRLYGTDIMIGLATPNFALDQSSSKYSSLLGSDNESWGFSYTGKLQHAGECWAYCSGFELGDKIGAHLDTWNGTLTFYKNEIPLGIAFRGLRCHPSLYPVVCSTAAQISMSLVKAISIPTSLFSHCCKVSSKYPHLIERILDIPGLKVISNHKWLIQASDKAQFIEDEEFLMYFCKKPAPFRKDHGLSTYLMQKFVSQEENPRFSGLMDQAVTRSGAWGEFTDESLALPSTNIDNTENGDIYSNLMSSDEEDAGGTSSEDMFDHKEERIRFTNSFSSPICEICRLKPAVSVKSCLKKCLQCFLTKK